MTSHSGNQLLDPELLLQKAQLQPGMRAADFGCGRTGHIIFPASRLVGERGIIYAVDILQDVLETVAKRAQMDQCGNIHTVWSDIEQVGKIAIPEQSLDTVFLINVLWGVQRHESVLSEAWRLLKEKGRLIVVDWGGHELSFSPPKEKLVHFSALRALAEKQGFATQELFPAGAYHEGIVFFKQL